MQEMGRPPGRLFFVMAEDKRAHSLATDETNCPRCFGSHHRGIKRHILFPAELRHGVGSRSGAAAEDSKSELGKEGCMSVRGLVATVAGGLVISLAAGSISQLQAQATTATTKTNAATTKKTNVTSDTRSDSRFIREVNADNTLEVSLGQLAQQKAENSEVKQFGQRMVTDHTKSQNEWTDVASKNGLTVKAGMGTHHRAKLSQLQKLSGKAFDKAYMTTEIRDHKDDIDYFQREGQAVHSTPVKDLVASTLPVLQDHFTQAKQVGAKVGADTTAALRQHVAAKK